MRTTKNTNYYTEPDTNSQTEYNLMRTSIIAKGGFYVARYEAGYSMETGRILTDSSTVVVPLSKKGAYPYNLVTWSDAELASQSMYTNTTKYGVASTLCYGVQWDAMLSFLEKTSETDSTDWGNYYNAGPFNFSGAYYKQVWDDGWENMLSEGWYTDTKTKMLNTIVLLQTGATERNCYKNIYDVAGNVEEWTMEQKVSSRIVRGGDNNDDGDYSSVGWRGFFAPYLSSDGRGFRVTLYIL